MSDLHFTIEDNGAARGGPQTIAPHEVPVAGEMDHLPDSSGNAQAPQSTLQYVQEQLKSSAHPTVVIFHILFKALSLCAYMFGGLLLPSSRNDGGGNFITLTVGIILLLAADFWVVKNVTGRLLVGLRWWNKVNEDSTTWIFESAEQNQDNPRPINKFDRSVFWSVLYATPVVWGLMLVLAVLGLKLQWFLVCIMALALSCSNVYGYYKCSSEQKAQIQQFVQRGTQEGAMAVMRSSMLSVLTGQNAGGNTGGNMS